LYSLKSGKLAEARKQLDKVYKFAPDSAQLNFLYGYLFFGLKDLDKAESYLSRAVVLDPRREQPLRLLGRVQLQRHHDHDAQTSLERAIVINSRDRRFNRTNKGRL
jgi:tetratricopeptide (TPR) repeat protein